MRAACRVVIWAMLALALPALAHAEELDCDTVTTPVDKLICSDSDMVKLDAKMTTLFGDVLSDGKASKTDTSAIEHDQKAWARGRTLCSNVKCMEAYYQRRLNTLKEAFVRIHNGMVLAARENDPVNHHTYVGTWGADGDCTTPEKLVAIEAHMIKIGTSDWIYIDHDADDTYHGLPMYYIEDKDARSIFTYDTHVDMVTYAKGGLGSGPGEQYQRCK